MSRHRKYLILLFAILVLQSIAPPSLYSQISIHGPLARDQTTASDTVYTGEITIKNETERAQTVQIRTADYSFTAEGENFFSPPGTHKRSNASWIEYNPSQLVLPPETARNVSYTVDVPATTGTDSLKGSYWSVLLVETQRPNHSSAQSKDVQSEGFDIRIRYAVQIATHIKPRGQGNVEFMNVELVSRDKKKLLQIDIKNVGAWLMTPETWVELFNVASGQREGRIETADKRIYPSTSVRYTYDLSGIPSGTYQTMVVVKVGSEQAFGGQYLLDL